MRRVGGASLYFGHRAEPGPRDSRRLAATAGLDVDLDATYVLWVYGGKVLKKAASMYVPPGLSR